MKKIMTIILAVLLAVSLFIFSSPTRAIKVGALKQGCVWREVMDAEFEKTDTLGTGVEVYQSNHLELCDKLTGSGHSTWYVHRVGFLCIPEWAGNG